MPRITSLATALPPNRVTQAEVRATMAERYRDDRTVQRLLPVFDRTGVDRRYFVKTLDWYAQGPSFETRNQVFAECGLELAARAVRGCLDRANITAEQVDYLFCVTTTGLMTPSLDARLVATLGLRADTRRVPLFGLGCAGGAGGLIRAADVLRANHRQRALVVSLELCSLVFSPVARSATDVVGVALFGDGAAAALVSGDELPSGGAMIRDTRTHLFKNAPDLMGWNFTSDGMRLVLSRDVPAFVGTDVGPVVGRFLSDQGLSLPELQHFVLHPGGAKIMTTYRTALGVPETALALARDTMRHYGNQSSASVLFMLSDLMASGAPSAGDLGFLVAMGPGFAAEMLTLSW